eukprot:250750_1
MASEPVAKKKKKKKKKKKQIRAARLQSPSNTLTPTNHYGGSSGAPAGAPTFVGDDITNPSPRLIQHILATKIQLFKLDIAKRERINLGKKVAAIVPHEGTLSIFNIIVYESKNRRLTLTIPIDSTFNLGILAPTSISLNDPTNTIYSFTFADADILYEFVCACCMVKILRSDINTDNHRMIIQDLNNKNNQSLSVNNDTSCAHTILQIWLANHTQHPYKRGALVFKGDKSVYLKTGKWIMPAVMDALKGMRPKQKRLIITPPQFGFGENGNDKLQIRKNSTLIIEIELLTIEQSKLPQYGSNRNIMNIVKQNPSKSDIGASSKSNAIEVHHLRKENHKLKEEILRLNARINGLVHENTELKQTVEFHQIEQIKKKSKLRKVVDHERKKLENDLTEFGGKFEAYSMEIDYTKKHYLEWNASDIIDWVLSLNYGSFAKYSSLLRRNIPKQNISGKHLSKLDKSEWKSLGILDFDDCLSVIDHVRALTMKEKKEFANNFEKFANNFDPNVNLFD